MSVKLRERPKKDGSIILYLDIYHKGKRWYEFLSNLTLPRGNTPPLRQTRKENLELANKILVARSQQLEASDYDVATDASKKVVVIQWMNNYAKNYTKADIRVIEAVVAKFSKFLTEKKLSGLLMKDFTESIVLQFVDKLKKDCKGEGAKSYYGRFRKIVKAAYRENLLLKNPCEFVTPPRGQAEVKDVLTFKELQLLANTPTEAKEVKRAFLFSSVTGLAWVDVKALTWEKINLKERIMRLVRSKLGVYNKSDDYPLNDTALELLGEPGTKKDLVFDLPTANGANKSLKLWVKRAKIDKNLTWHCGRHSYGSNLILNGTDILTTSRLLGHSTLRYTKLYTRASAEMNQKAVDNLPKINL